MWELSEADAALLRSAPFLLVFFAVAGSELWSPRRETRLSPVHRWFSNLALFATNLALAVWFFPAPSSVQPILARLIEPLVPVTAFWHSAAGLILGILVLDLSRYVSHRLHHLVPLLWRFHAVHHGDPEVDVSTSVRHHPIENVTAGIATWLAVAGLGVSEAALIWYVVLDRSFSFYGHGNIRVSRRVEALLAAVFVTNDMHRTHHAMDMHYGNSNFGSAFSFWDRLFGTFAQLPASRRDQIPFGVPGFEAESDQRLDRLLAQPFMAPPAFAPEVARA